MPHKNISWLRRWSYIMLKIRRTQRLHYKSHIFHAIFIHTCAIIVVGAVTRTGAKMSVGSAGQGWHQPSQDGKKGSFGGEGICEGFSRQVDEPGEVVLTYLQAWASEGRANPPCNLKFSAKKVVFLVLSGKKHISLLLTPLEKRKIPWWPPWKNPPDAMLTGKNKQAGLKKDYDVVINEKRASWFHGKAKSLLNALFSFEYTLETNAQKSYTTTRHICST